MALISIILPVHNGATTLSQAVATCLQQTHDDLELVVIDDASNDETWAVLDHWARRDRRLRPRRSPTPLGVAAAFQLGLKEARGQWIARMDADDLNHPQRLEKQMALLQSRPELDAVSCLIEIRKRTSSGDLNPAEEGYQRFARWLNHLTSSEQISAARFIDQPLVNPTMLVRRCVLERLGGYRPGLEWAEDYDFWLRLFQDGGRIAKVTETLFTWLDHPGRLTRSHPAYTQQAFIRCKAHYLARLPRVQDRGIALCGAGPIGKSMAQALTAAGASLHCFYDVHPRRIGETIHGAPVLSMEHWGSCQTSSPVVLGAVGQPEKRQHLLQLAKERGHVEGLDFFSTA